jgi:hypothetical protein
VLPFDTFYVFIILREAFRVLFLKEGFLCLVLAGQQVVVFLGQLASAAAERMNKAGVRGKQVALKVWRAVANAPDAHRKGSVGHGLCDHVSRSVALPVAAASPQALADAAARIWHALGVPAIEVIGWGGVSNFAIFSVTCPVHDSRAFCQARSLFVLNRLVSRTF